MNLIVYLYVHPQLISVWFFIRQREANYLQQACWGVTPRERVGSVNNYPTSKIRIWSIYSEVFDSQCIHCALWNPLKRKSLTLSLIFWTENLSSCWLSREMWIREGRQMGFYELKVWGKRRLDDFFNLGHIMFTHTCHCFSGCEEAHNYPINRSLNGMK